MIEIYTDGSCRTGEGGYAAVILHPGHQPLELSGRESSSTNNRMEMMAAIVALESLPRGSQALVYSDSSYLIRGISGWVTSWQRNGWKTKEKKDVLNKDLWLRLLAACKTRNVQWQWVKGHNGNQWNERCDELAKAAA